MSDSSSLVVPISWVIKRDGSQVPFDAGKISRSLFAAGEELSRADAFLCRELTDGVLLFLNREHGGQILATSAIADLVVKVVRELGQPELARQYESGKDRQHRNAPERGPARRARQADWMTRHVQDVLARDDSLAPETLENELTCLLAMRSVFQPDILAAQADGLIHLGSLRSCHRLLASVIPWHSDMLDMIESMAHFRQATGDALILDCPPRGLAANARVLALGLGEEKCHLILNLGRSADQDDWSAMQAAPLFGTPRDRSPEVEPGRLDLSLCDELAQRSTGSVQFNWHLTQDSFAPGNESLLREVLKRALSGQRFCFIFDRPNHVVRLGEGIDRGQKAVLMAVGLNLVQLSRQMGEPRTPQRFLAKLASLVRIGLSAAVQKRNHLRALKEKNSLLAQGFLLEKARIVLVPIGLDAAARDLVGQGCCAPSSAGLTFVCRVLEALRRTAQEDGRALLLDATVDSPLTDDLFPPIWQGAGNVSGEQCAGITAWDDDASLQRQIDVCGSMHDVARAGTAIVRLNRDSDHSPDELLRALRYAWEKTDVMAVRLVPGGGVAGARGDRTFLPE